MKVFCLYLCCFCLFVFVLFLLDIIFWSLDSFIFLTYGQGHCYFVVVDRGAPTFDLVWGKKKLQYKNRNGSSSRRFSLKTACKAAGLYLEEAEITEPVLI